jgi:hypothetical protein
MVANSIADVTEANILKLIFNATPWANVADNAAASPITQIAVALHTADPGEAGTQATSEVAYTSYARVNVNRNSGGWTISGTNPTVASPVAAITFPAGTGGSGTVTNFSVGKTGGGASDIYWSGTVIPNIVCGNGVTPQLTTASTIALD